MMSSASNASTTPVQCNTDGITAKENAVFHRSDGPIPEVGFSFHVPYAYFRMRWTSGDQEGEGWQKLTPKIWTYEADLVINEQEEHAEISVGKWTIVICRTMLPSSTYNQYAFDEEGESIDPSYSEKQVMVFIEPPNTMVEAVSANVPRMRNLKVEFWISIEKRAMGTLSNVNSICKGYGSFQHGAWHCIPVKLPTGFMRFLPDSSMDPQTTCTVDLLFHVTLAGSRTLDKFTGLARKLESALKSSDFYDCSLVSADEKTFPAHRLILAAHSTVFASAFANDKRNQSVNNYKVSMNGDILELTLEFLYGRTVSEKFKNSVEEILSAANTYKLDDLRDVCENVMVARLNKDNAVRYFGLSVTSKLSKLTKAAARFVAQDH